MHRCRRNGFLRIVAGVAVCCLICSQVMPTFATEPTDGLTGNPSETVKAPLDLTGMVLHTHNKFCYDANKNLICPLPKVEEHEHSDDCYEEQVKETEPVGNHTHSSACYTMERGNQTCTLAEQAGHSHTDACYEPLEKETAEPHVHTNSCYFIGRGSQTCTVPEREAHTHGDSCLGRSEELICTEESEEHTHSDACYGTTVICGQEEDPGHTHGDDCYEWVEVLICNLEELLPDATEPDRVLICTETELAAHTHGDECFEWTEVLSCGMEETSAESTEPTEPEKVLVCTKVELINHIHAEECYETDLLGVKHLICGQYQMEEHQHRESCLSFSKDALICELEEGETHTHSYGCYSSWTFRCQMPDEPENESTTETATEPVTEPVTEPATEPETEPATDPGDQPDPTADVESRKDWEKTFADVELTGAWSYDLIAIAQTQLGYKESERNFVVRENGEHKGYTRYGDWYGYNYVDWCAIFVSFCLNYAEIEDFPHHHGCDQWIAELKEANLYATADVYLPKPGDVVFFDCSRKSLTSHIDADHVGIVTEVIPATQSEPGRITTIEGNKKNSVSEGIYCLDDLRILGYGILPDGPAAVYTCGLEAHTHDLDYYTEGSQISCQLEEHIHSEICRSRKLQYEDESLWVDITLTNAVYLPENLELRIVPDFKGQELSDEAMAAIAAVMADVEEICICRMELLADGQPYQLPTGTYADVQAYFAQPVLAVEDASNLHLLMLTEEKADGDSAVNGRYLAEELPVICHLDSDGGIVRLYCLAKQLSTAAIVSGEIAH